MLRGLAIQISRSDRRREAHLSGVAFPCQEPFFTFLATSFNLRQPQMIPSAAPDSPRAHVRPAGWPPGPRAGSLTPASRASARALDDDPDFKDLHHHQPSGSSLPCRTRARFVAERAACVKPVWTTTGYRHLSRPSSIYNVAAPIPRSQLPAIEQPPLGPATSCCVSPSSQGAGAAAPKGRRSSRLAAIRPVPKTHGKRGAPGQALELPGCRTPGVLPFVCVAWRSAFGFTPECPSDDP